MYKYGKLWVTFILFLFLFVHFAHPVAAKSVNMKVSVDEGFDGKVKRGEGFPASIKLENNGEEFSGDLLIQYNPSYNSGGVISLHVELPQGSTKTYQVALPGIIEDSGSSFQKSPMIHLYKGSWKKGNEVTFQGEKSFKPKYIDAMEQVVGVLSENDDRLKEWRVIPSVQMLPLTKEEMPKQALGLEMLDYLVVDEYAVSQLDEQQQLAIKKWIHSGGVLIAGAAPDASGSYGLLYPLLPMKIEKESTGSTNFLLTPKNDKIDFKDIKLFTGTVDQDAQILRMSDTFPATIRKHYGSGTILQTSFSLGDEPLASWKGYNSWFEFFMQEADQGNVFSNRNGDLYDQLYYEFAETNEFFPASHYSISQLVIIMLVYLLVIVPILYVVLRKLDKREHSWWIIPSLAIVMSAVVFGLGAKDRIAEPQLNQMGVYKNNNGQLTGIQATTLLSNRSGEYRLTIPKGQFNAVPHMNNSSIYDPSTGAVISEQRKVNEIIFHDVGYWSSKTLYGKAQKETDGHLTVKLSLKNNQLTGTVQNGYSYDFDELFIWSGNEKIKLGALKKGEILKINQKIKQNFLTGSTMLSNGNMYPNPQIDLEKMKKERLEYAASIFLLGGQQGSNNQPLIAGITKEAIADVNMVGKKEKQNNLNLIVTPFEAETDFLGKFSLTTEMLNTRVEVVTGLIHEQKVNGSPNEVVMEDGEYDYILELPKQLKGKKLDLESVKLQMNGPFLQYSILNRVTGEYLPIKESQNSFTLNKADHVEEFFSNDGELLIKVHKNTKGDPYTYLPTITVKGEVTP